jgi:hypothetical protein
MNKPLHNLIAIKTKKKRRAKFIAHNFAHDTYDFNSAGEKILVDHPAGIGALKRAYYQLCTSDLPCVWIRLTDEEARATYSFAICMRILHAMLSVAYSQRIDLSNNSKDIRNFTPN